MAEANTAERDARRLALRKQFLLRPDIIFLNHGSFGACPQPVFDVYQRWQREMERQPVDFLMRSRRFTALMREARQALGTFIGADADDLVFVTNATTALNIVAKSLRLNPGDEVLATDHEYGALDRTWRFVCQRQGAAYVRASIPIPVEPSDRVVETIWSRVTPRTRVMFLSHITSATALIMPIGELIRRARAAGILTVIDGAHAPGQIPLDLEALGADFYAGNCHKWMCAPKSSAFLYARRRVQPLLDPLVVSWGWQADDPGPSRFVDEHEWQGTRDIAAFLAVPAAIEFLRAHEWDAVRQECHGLARDVRTAIGSITGLPQICPDDPTWYAQMASVLLPPCDADRLMQRLRDDFRVEVPVWGGDLPLMRVSVQGYNTLADLDGLVGALARVLPEMRPAGDGVRRVAAGGYRV